MNPLIRNSLLCICVVAAAAFVFLKEPKFVSQEIETEQKFIFHDLPIGDIHTLVVSNRYGTLTIESDGTKWFIKEKEDYQANTLRMNEVLSALAELTIIQKTTVDTSKWEQLGVQDPSLVNSSGAGCRVELLGSNGYRKEIIVGKLQASGSEAARMFGNEFDGRNFVRIADNEAVYLVEQSLSFFNTIPSDWMLNILSNPHAYKSIIYVKDGVSVWHMKRDSREDAYRLYNGLETTGERLPNLTTTVDYSFSSMFIRDVLPKAHDTASVDIDTEHYFELEALDGFALCIYLGGKTRISEQERQENKDSSGVLRKVRASAYRYALLDWEKERSIPIPEEPPYAKRIYLIDCPQMDDLMISYDEMRVFERMSPASGN
ncbi:MAG: DUF4340 domain-containing protein [Opitutaceae bacterium]